ncbi:MAG: response regulator [Opitutaceae bacterium]|nr:response regulator [Opitutaceae bacterium]
MASLPTQPQIHWLRRLSAISAVALIALGVAILSGWSSTPDLPTALQGGDFHVRLKTGLGLIFFGTALLGYYLGLRSAAWLALVPAAFGGLAAWEFVMRQTSALGREIVQDPQHVASASTVGFPLMLAGGFLAVGSVIAWLARRRRPRYRTPALALVGTVAMAVGFATVVGYLLNLPPIYSWGTSSELALISAASLLGLGATSMIFAWREAAKVRPGAPAWIPLPVIVGSLALTLIFASGLRTRDLEFGRTNTEFQLNGFASATDLELDRQLAAFTRLGRRWGTDAELAPAVRDADAAAHLADSPGAHSIVWLDSRRNPVRIFPLRGNEGSLGISYDQETVRRETLDVVENTLGAAVSRTLEIPGMGPGFVIFAPLLNENRVVGYVGAEFTYRRFFGAIDMRMKLAGRYHCVVLIDGTRVYPAVDDAAGIPDEAIVKTFTVHDRRVRIELSPTLALLRSNRRYLPELALVAGIGITLLLGLSVHLARAARSGLRAAEQSNKRLLAENDERRRVEGMLKVSDERLRLALDSTLLGIFEWQLATNRVYYSPGIWSIVGLDPTSAPMTIEVWESLVHPDDRERYQDAWNLHLRGERSFIDPEYRIRVADGSWRWIYARSRGFTANDQPGVPTRIVGTVQDITSRKAGEHALRESQSAARKLSLVASRTDNLVIIAKPDGTIEWVNESFLRVMEYSLAEVVGRGPQFFMMGPESDPRIVRRVKTAMERGEGISTDLINYSKSGRKYHVHLEVQPVRNEQGVLENFIAIEADITGRVATENALRRAKAEADDASRAKSEFLASMSHEIRTPMNGVIGMTSLLLETPLSPEQADYVATIRSSGEALLTIINDILDFSKIESGKMELEREPVDLQACIEEAFDLFAMAAAARNVELTYFVQEGVPDWIAGDATRLRQILVNLVNNAVKFTPAGTVAVEVAMVDPPADVAGDPRPAWARFSVHDTGIGIPPERVDRLFKPFSQVDSSTTRKYGGTGLGLAICQRLTSLMGGTIRVESEINRGSVFSFTIPIDALPQPVDSLQLSLPRELAYQNVLCVDDDARTLQRLARLLRAGEAVPALAESTEAAEAFLSKAKPAAVIIDFGVLASERGESFSSQLASMGLPTVLLMPIGRNSGHFHTHSSVATAAKPLKTQSLLRALGAIMASSRKQVAESAPALAAPQSLSSEIPLSVLVVEDNPVNQKVALRFLERLGYRAAMAANGLEALAALERHPHDLVFMDLQMPEMDGFEASRKIREMYPKSRQPTIVALTANASQGDREACLSAGMDDYVTKPVKLQEIVAVIRKHFAARKGGVALPSA